MHAPLNHKVREDYGFSLLEIIITLAILASIMLVISSLLRNTVDVRIALSSKNRVTQRMSRAMQQLSSDLSHTYILDAKDFDRGAVGRKRTLFRITKRADGGDQLAMTYMGHQARKANSKESDYSFVMYELQSSEQFPQRKNLMRGELLRIPSGEYKFKEQPPMTLFVPHVKNLKIDAWTGDGWSRDGWDSHQQDTENKIPQMVRITLELWEDDPIEGVEADSEEAEGPTVTISTITALPYAMNIKELKSRNTSLDLSRLE